MKWGLRLNNDLIAGDEIDINDILKRVKIDRLPIELQLLEGNPDSMNKSDRVNSTEGNFGSF